MKVASAGLLFYVTATLALESSSADASQQQQQQLRRKVREQKKQSRECVIVAEAGSRFLQGIPIEGGEEEFVCEMDPIDNPGQGLGVSGLSLPLLLDDAQKAKLREDLNSGAFVSGRDLYFDRSATITKNGVRVPPGPVKVIEGQRGRVTRRRTQLGADADKHVLVVKANAQDYSVAATPAAISDDIFGTGTDTFTMVTQFRACSFGQLEIKPGCPPTGCSIAPHEDAPGVITVNIPLALTNNTRTAIRNAITTAAQAKLGFNLPGPFEQVMYIVQGCYVDCGWAAYAAVNSWYSVYQGNYYKYPGVQMHELGHNFNLAHSGGLDGQAYSDHSCLMGNPWYSDDKGRQCYNNAKNFQLPWYSSNKLTVNPRVTSTWNGILVGISDFQNNPQSHPVVVKIETNTNTDAFVGFNRATGINNQTKEGANQVTIIETGNNGVGYSQSYLKAKMSQGEIYTWVNWQATGKTLTVEVVSINLAVDPATATVKICLGGCVIPTASPISLPPTASPIVG